MRGASAVSKVVPQEAQEAQYREKKEKVNMEETSHRELRMPLRKETHQA